MRIAIVAMRALVCGASSVEARPRHVAHQYSPECNVPMPCEAVGKTVVNANESQRLARGRALYNAMLFGMPALHSRYRFLAG